MNPCVSVVIPTKDRLRYLEQVLPTFFSQPEVREVVVVVDGSTDGTQDFLHGLAEREPRLVVLDNGPNRGIPFTKNRGVQAATSEYTFIAEDDLELTPGFFGTLVPHLQASEADVMCGRNIFRYDHETADEAVTRVDKLTVPMVDRRLVEVETGVRLDDDTVLPIIAAPMLARTEVFQKVGFDEQYKVNFWREETDFQFSAQEAGYVLASCPHATCFNFIIEHDRGGVHATIGYTRTKWVVKNNWRFLNKHHAFIAQHFDVGNRHLYIVRFAISKFATQLFNYAVSTKKRFIPGRTA